MQKISMPAPGDELELLVSDLNTDGSAVAKKDGLVFFIDTGLPGELLKARVESSKKNLVRAVRLATLRPSPDEVEPFCAHFGDCGGCTWQNLSYPAQLLWKHGRVEAALHRIAKVNIDLPPILPSPAQRAFRNKMEYAFGEEEGKLVLGLRRRFSREVCPVQSCPVQLGDSAQLLKTVQGWALKHGLHAWDGKNGGLRHFIIRTSSFQDPNVPENAAAPRMAELLCGGDPVSGQALEELHAALQKLGIDAFTVSRRTDKNPLSSAQRVLRHFGAENISEKIGHLVLKFPAQGFVQTNAAAAALLYEEARSMANLQGTEELWDIYSGVGALGLFMAERAKKVVGVELSGGAVKIAERNAQALGFEHCSFVKGDAAQILSQLDGQPDVLLADPPRGGMSQQLVPAIKAKRPRKIVYVSCDPSTLARDIAALAPLYELKKIRGVDMFPHTPHVECAALLELAD